MQEKDSNPGRRQPAIRHCTSQPLRFFGRQTELDLLDAALHGQEPSVVAMVGPGGQGKTAIVQHWLRGLTGRLDDMDGLFLWSFYRGKDSDLCLRELLAYAERLEQPPEVSASFCVERLLPRLRQERWALVLDGTEVVQHEQGQWFGRFVHPELGRLLDELASAPLPGVVVLTSRFPLPSLASRRHARVLSLSTLDQASGRALLASLGVQGDAAELDEAAQAGGLHAKAVELLGTYLTRFAGASAAAQRALAPVVDEAASSEELHVARILAAFHAALPADSKDILALATSFRQPPTEARLLDYLVSPSVRHLLHDTWGRRYVPFQARAVPWLAGQVADLVALRLLERVGTSLTNADQVVIDAHPLVRSGFAGVLGTAGHSAQARAGFLRGRPDRRPPQSLEEAREEVELFHAYADAGLWNEADSTFVALDNPKHRFLAPAFERDLLLRFFAGGDHRQPPLWPGFGRYRSLAICFELLGDYDTALETYRSADAPLRGDALIALGRLQPLIDQAQAAQPWQTLWQAYRAHALCLQGRTDEAARAAQACVPIDIYEWVHVFECLLRLGRLDSLDLRSVLYRSPLSHEHCWSALARRRMRADYVRVQEGAEAALGAEYRELLDAYDRGGLPYERALTRLSYARWLTSAGERDEAQAVAAAALDVGRRYRLTTVEIDALEVQGDAQAPALRSERGILGPSRP
jgi:tetratricopeptide (TPR) repeat protein